MTERDANQLAADVRRWIRGDVDAPHDALDELLALVGTLQQERDHVLARELTHARIAVERAEAAEAALAATRQALAEIANLDTRDDEAALDIARRALAAAGGDTKEPATDEQVDRSFNAYR